MIEFSALEEMFENIQTKTDWNINGSMLWGYFFTDKSSQKLEAAAIELEASGYRYVDLYLPDLGEGEEQYFFLHMEKEEIHSPVTLHQRNIQLYAFADKHSLDSYDGMDVGPVKI